MLGDLAAQDRPEADHRVALEHAELLDLDVVVVVAPGDARVVRDTNIWPKCGDFSSSARAPRASVRCSSG